MRAFFVVFCLFLTAASFAEEKTVQVGKHVTPSTDVVTMILSLFLVLLVVIISAYILKKFQITAQGTNQSLKVITSVHLGAKERVVVVQVADKQLVLGVTTTQITLLDTLDKPIESANKTSEFFDKSVVNMLKNSIKKND